jgi:cellulose synthase/poly-beta-1,6-N-acetylglucosamine synthase-like glycosyltransferase
MESFIQLSLSVLFLIAVILIWFMIGYQLVLTIAGFFHHMGSRKERREVDGMDFDYPAVSILIPAHNEEIVIAATLDAMIALDYPHDKLEIIVINDGSTDATGDIVADYASKDARVLLHNVPRGEGGRGKSRALNIGLSIAQSPYIAIYDADNTPAPDALRYLVAQLLLHPELGAVLGKFRTVNKDRNLLTRFINIETLSFQSMLQAGRWRLFRIATLPGTNFVIRKEVLDQVGGWDEEAITEDSELSIRMYMNQWRIKFIPYAVTYEQEPERWDVWLRQRTRWVRGNNYVAKKFFGLRKEIKSKRLQLEILYLFAMYYIFFVAILISDFIFILTATQVVSIPLPGPYNMVWVLAVVLFFGEILLALSYDREDSPRAVWLMVLMYFTYCQMWIVVVAKAFYLDVIRKEKRVWIKTIRFSVKETPKPFPKAADPAIGPTPDKAMPD